MNTADGSSLSAMSTPRKLVGVRRLQLLLIAIAGVVASVAIGLSPRELVPSSGGLELICRFLSGAVSPAATYEAEFVPAGTPPFVVKVSKAIGQTVIFAAAAISLAMPAGLVLGVLSSTRLRTEGFGECTVSASHKCLLWVAVALCWMTRVTTAFARSIHELLWAVLFLAAIGLSNLAAVLAIAIPYSGILAKVFSEMIDEAPQDAADQLQSSGASGWQVFTFGILPRALPDMISYACYRFECALRSSAVLGFFGIPTIGYHLQLSFLEGHYHETWTCLYALGCIVVLADWWSAAMRRRLVT